jgi:DNA replication protein DnaC
METRKTTLPSFSELLSQLQAQKTIRQGFRLPLSREDAYRLLYAAYRAEVEHSGRTFKSDDDTLRVINEVASYLTLQEKMLTGMMFCGVCGNGKTTMLYAIQNAINWIYRHNLFPPHYADEKLNSMPIVDAKALVRRILSKPDSFRRTPLLGIEDLGREPAEVKEYGNVVYPITDLFEDRYNDRLFTIITTNLTGAQLKERYDTRVTDRMNELLHIIVFRNASYR